MDDLNLAKIREHLAKFERYQKESISLTALNDGLKLLYNLSSKTNDEDTAIKCKNIVQTYQTMIEKEATRRLNNKDSIGAEELVHWYSVMTVFKESSFHVSEVFHSLWQELERTWPVFEKWFLKLFKEANPSAQQEILRVLGGS